MKKGVKYVEWNPKAGEIKPAGAQQYLEGSGRWVDSLCVGRPILDRELGTSWRIPVRTPAPKPRKRAKAGAGAEIDWVRVRKKMDFIALSDAWWAELQRAVEFRRGGGK